MLCIFQGKERIRDANRNIISEGRDAGKIQTDIHTKVGQCEHSNAVQERKEGCFNLVLKTETITEAATRIRKEHEDKHFPFDSATVKSGDCQTSIVGETLSATPREVFISPLLKKDDGTPVVIADFPDGHKFGNGVTANSRVKLKDGSVRYFTWCVLPEGVVLTPAQKDLLCSICEN